MQPWERWERKEKKRICKAEDDGPDIYINNAMVAARMRKQAWASMNNS
jgi:hypothetical protein